MKYKWGDRSWEFYKPKVNRKRQIILVLSFLPFFFTIGTNWIYFVGLKLLLKLNPLFLYK